MEVAILFLVLSEVLLAIASGIWVAVALVRAISVRPTMSERQGRQSEEGGG